VIKPHCGEVLYYASRVIAEGDFTRPIYTKSMYWVYIMESGKGSWYIGQTSDLQKRIREHKNGYGSETTAKQQNWKCIYCEGYINHKDAIGRERYLKSGAGRRFLDEQLAHYLLERID
jgi:predicted GIY-YIG superfamily endonuclease